MKRARSNTPSRGQPVTSSSGDGRQKGLVRSVSSTSVLEAPIINLSGAHSVSVVRHTRVSFGGSYAACQGRDTELSIRSYRTKHCCLFSRQKRLCVLSFLARSFAPTLTTPRAFSPRRSPTPPENNRRGARPPRNALYPLDPHAYAHALVHADADPDDVQSQQPFPTTARRHMGFLALPTRPRKPPRRAPGPPRSPKPQL